MIYGRDGGRTGETRERWEKRGGAVKGKDGTWRNGENRFMELNVIERWMEEREEGGGGTEREGGREGRIMKGEKESELWKNGKTDGT